METYLKKQSKTYSNYVTYYLIGLNWVYCFGNSLVSKYDFV